MTAAPAFELTIQTPVTRKPRVRPISLKMTSREEEGTRTERRGTFSCIPGTPLEQLRRYVAGKYFGSLGGAITVDFAHGSTSHGVWSATDWY
jgi:hypothetical protein